MKTPFQNAGFTADSVLTLKPDHNHFHFKQGETFKLQEDDGSDSPLFFDNGDTFLYGVAVPVSFIELAKEAALAVQSPAADTDGWIEWAGGECPVPEGTLVDVKHRDGDFGYECLAGTQESMSEGVALAYRWSHAGTCGDIIAYRLCPQQDANTRANDDRLDAAVGLYSTSEGEIEEANLNECIGQAQESISEIRGDLLEVLNSTGLEVKLANAIKVANALIEAGYRKQ